MFIMAIYTADPSIVEATSKAHTEKIKPLQAGIVVCSL
jgi:hypothetical protein